MNSIQITVTDNEKFEVDGIEMWADFRNADRVTIWMDGGYAQDDEGNWWECDGNHIVDQFDVNTDDDEVEITLSAAVISKAKEYRTDYPVDVE